MSTFKVKVDHIPSVTRYEIPATEFHQKLLAAIPSLKDIKLDDGKYFYVSWEDWDKIFNHVQSKLPSFKEDAFDCDNFADLIKVRVAELFQVNTCARVDGNCYLGRHAWNVFFDGTDFYQLESQKAGDIVDIDDPRYVPEELVAG